jgi:hypothetical protein
MVLGIEVGMQAAGARWSGVEWTIGRGVLAIANI